MKPSSQQEKRGKLENEKQNTQKGKREVKTSFKPFQLSVHARNSEAVIQNQERSEMRFEDDVSCEFKIQILNEVMIVAVVIA